MPISALFPLMVNGHFNGTGWHASLVEFLFAGGMLIAGLIMGIWGGLKDKFLMINLSLAALGLMIAIAGILPPSAFMVFALLSGLMGVTGNFFSIPFMAYVQTVVPPESLGRVFSMLLSIMSLAMPLGLLATGPIAELIGVANCFALAGSLMIVSAVGGYFGVKRVERKVEREG